VRLLELTLARWIVEAIGFDSADPALPGEMTIVVTFEAAPGRAPVAPRERVKASAPADGAGAMC
jgi:hypothetical protein